MALIGKNSLIVLQNEFSFGNYLDVFTFLTQKTISDLKIKLFTKHVYTKLSIARGFLMPIAHFQ